MTTTTTKPAQAKARAAAKTFSPAPARKLAAERQRLSDEIAALAALARTKEAGATPEEFDQAWRATRALKFPDPIRILCSLAKFYAGTEKIDLLAAVQKTKDRFPELFAAVAQSFQP